MTGPVRLAVHTAADVDRVGLWPQLLDTFCEVYPDRLDDPFWGVDAYRSRVKGYLTRDGFRLVLGYDGADLVGYAMGFTLPADTRWWAGLLDPVDPDLTAEDGKRTIGVTEIMVRAPWRRRGYARALHDELLAGRPEPRASLLVLPENVAAQAAYRSWGYHRVGAHRPVSEAPVYDAMLLAR